MGNHQTSHRRPHNEITFTVECVGESGGEDPASALRSFRNALILRALWDANDFSGKSFELPALDRARRERTRH
ncbi:MAG: hypothetical protein M2R45_04556 [Verrucomicrobia subdivision 3 bacterium]|nr:hypothetical protein [Limisphaerales bacterium]MCS1416805.1 hypothetical protein [Limisphaerales bacterium]